MNALDGCLNEQKENVADVKLIQDQFDCHMSGLVDEDRDEQVGTIRLHGCIMFIGV